jgi:hypothetical protein
MCRGRRQPRCRPRTRQPAATPPVPGCCQPVRRGQSIGDRAPHRPAGPPRRSPVLQSGRSGGPVVALRPGHATSARSSGFPPGRPRPGRLSGRPSGRRQSWWPLQVVRAPSVPSRRRLPSCPTRLRPRRTRWRVARPAIGVRAWRRGSLTSPVVPGATLRPGSAGGHDRSGIGWPVRRGGC